MRVRRVGNDRAGARGGVGGGLRSEHARPLAAGTPGVQPVPDGPLAVGSHIREVLAWRGREIVIDDVVTALEPARKLALRGGWKAADFEVEFTLRPVGDATEVTMDWPFYPKSFVVKLAAPFMGPAMRKSTREELELLKAYVESDGAQGVTRE